MTALTVHNAEIKTATVEIRTLTISGKQVTLAVFRQLLQESWIDLQTAERRGPAWGVVNYHPDRQCGRVDDLRGNVEIVDHLHVVWQLGVELRRFTFHQPTRRLADLRPAWDEARALPQLFIAV